MLDRINDIYNESIQNQLASSKLLPEALKLGAEKIVDTLLKGGKIIVCGQGRSYGIAQFLTSNLLHQYELSRPSFPAVLLSLEPVLASALYIEKNQQNLFSRQLEAIAQKGDLIIVFTPCGDEKNIFNLMHYASSKELTIIALTGKNNDHVKGFLSEMDLEIPATGRKESRILEEHLFIANSLCELVDFSLFAHH